jgi:hypothetical protein
MEKIPPGGPIPVVDTPGDEPCAKIWYTSLEQMLYRFSLVPRSVYITEAEKYDKAMVDSWRGNMNGMLIFVGSMRS